MTLLLPQDPNLLPVSDRASEFSFPSTSYSRVHELPQSHRALQRAKMQLTHTPDNQYITEQLRIAMYVM
jgi:hypothetical protein